MDPDAIEAAINAQLGAQATSASTPDKVKGNKKPRKNKAIQLAAEDAVQVKKSKIVKEKDPQSPEARPFCYPSSPTSLHPDSIFNDSYDHSYLVGRMVRKSDRELVQGEGPSAGFRMARVAGLQLALVATELEKMFQEKERHRSEAAERLQGLASAEDKIAELRAEVERLKESKEAALKEKDEAFATERQTMVNQAASYLITGFERAKYQMSRVHPYANLSMLNVRIKNEDFVWEGPGSEEEEGDDEEGDERVEGGEDAPPS